MKEIDDMPQNSCPYTGTTFAFECPYCHHGVCSETSPCGGPTEIHCYDEMTDFTEEHFEAVNWRMKIRKLAAAIEEYTESLSVRDIHRADFADKFAAFLLDKGVV